MKKRSSLTWHPAQTLSLFASKDLIDPTFCVRHNVSQEGCRDVEVFKIRAESRREESR
jgi:hypothetical protein